MPVTAFLVVDSGERWWWISGLMPKNPFFYGLAVGLLVAVGVWFYPRERFIIVSSWKVPVRVDKRTGESWALEVGEGGRKYWAPMAVVK